VMVSVLRLGEGKTDSIGIIVSNLVAAGMVLVGVGCS